MNKILIIIRICFIIVLVYSCGLGKQISKNSDSIQSMIDKTKKGIVKIPKGTYLIDKPILISSDISILGNSAKFILTNHNIHALVIKNNKNVSISDVDIVGLRSGYNLEKYTHLMEKNLISIEKSNDITLSNIKLKSHTFTLLSIKDSKDITITDVHFSEIGTEKPNELPDFQYSYDGIYIVASENAHSKNINIKSCSFSNIGLGDFFKTNESRSDGDGIHFQSKNESGISEINIIDCNFINCSARGIKAQAGQNIEIKNSTFTNCISGIGFVQETRMSNILVTENKFDSCNIAVAVNHPLTISNVEILNNKIVNVNFGIRNSGNSSFSNLKIINNNIKNVQRCFFDGVIEKGEIKNNTIVDYGLARDESYYMAILLAGKSKDIIIIDNNIISLVNTKTVIYLYPEVSNIHFKKNEISLPETQFKKTYIIYSMDKNMSNQVKDNQVELIEDN